MKYLFALSLSLIVLSLHAAPADTAAPAANSREGELVALTNAWTNAINTKDRSKLDKLMAPEYMLHAWDDTWHVSRADWMKNLIEGYNIAEYHHSAIVARIYGSIGNVTSKWYWRGTFKEKPFEEHGYVLDVWQRKSGQWRVVSRISITLPGKE
jgi:hypothetical protein